MNSKTLLFVLLDLLFVRATHVSVSSYVPRIKFFLLLVVTDCVNTE